MSRNDESKHDRFLRLMQRRLERALEELRLVSQLSSDNYENSAEEAEEVIRHLDGAVHKIATNFGVNYTTAIGNPKPLKTSRKSSQMDPIEIAKALDLLRSGQLRALEEKLISALSN